MAGAAADDSPEVRTLSLLNEGIGSLESLPQLARRPPVLTTLNLHCNRITAISGLDHLAPCLTSLNLSSNRLRSMGGVWPLAQLEMLDLSCNDITAIDGLASLVRLKKLMLSYNRIESLAGGGCPVPGGAGRRAHMPAAHATGVACFPLPWARSRAPCPAPAAFLTWPPACLWHNLPRHTPRTSHLYSLLLRPRRNGASPWLGSRTPRGLRQPHQPTPRGRVLTGPAETHHASAATAPAGQSCVRCSDVSLALCVVAPAIKKS
jgi:hypothetical protein